MTAPAIVVYDATDAAITQVAEAFAAHLMTDQPATLLDASRGEQPSWDDVRLLVVGTPTIDRRPSPAIQAWLEAVEPPARRLAVAAFDTRPHGGWIRTGTGAGKVSRQLDRAGFLPNMGMETFYVDDRGELEADQIERAGTWALGLGIATGIRTGS